MHHSRYRTPGEVLDITPYGSVDKANALTHIPTKIATTNAKDSLILGDYWSNRWGAVPTPRISRYLLRTF